MKQLFEKLGLFKKPEEIKGTPLKYINGQDDGTAREKEMGKIYNEYRKNLENQQYQEKIDQVNNPFKQ